MKIKELKVTIERNKDNITVAYITQESALGEIRGANLLGDKMYYSSREAEERVISLLFDKTNRLTIRNLLPPDSTIRPLKPIKRCAIKNAS